MQMVYRSFGACKKEIVTYRLLIKPSCNFCETLTAIWNLNNEITRLQHIPRHFILQTKVASSYEELFLIVFNFNIEI